MAPPDTPLEKLLRQVDNADKWIGKIVRSLLDVLSDIKEYLGEETYKWVSDKLKQFQELAKRFFKKVYNALEHIGNSIHINEVADAWESGVSKAIDRVTSGKTGELEAYFGGQAAAAYFAAERNQLAALRGLRSKSAKIIKVLRDTADNIDSAHGAMATAFAFLATTLVASAPTIPPVISAPAGLSASAVGLATCTVTWGLALLDFNSDLEEARKTIKKIKFGTWKDLDPYTDMSDGSVSDGDGSGWKYRDK